MPQRLAEAVRPLSLSSSSFMWLGLITAHSFTPTDHPARLRIICTVAGGVQICDSEMSRVGRKVSRPGRPAEARLPADLDKSVRDTIQYAKDLSGADYAQIDNFLRKNDRWARNALNRSAPLRVSAAQSLMDWVKSVEFTDVRKRALRNQSMRMTGKRKEWSDRITAIRIGLRGLSGGDKKRAMPTPVPMLILHRHIGRVSKAFDAYLRCRGKTAAIGLLKDFLKQRIHLSDEMGEGTYARACAFKLSWEAREIFENSPEYSLTWKGPADGSAEVRKGIKLTPESLREFIFALEWFISPETLRRAQRKSNRRGAKSVARKSGANSTASMTRQTRK
jgi:hypothetical protein